MKILMVSMISLHFTRWVEQLKDSGHEIYWFDPLDGTYNNLNLNWIHYCKQWRLKWDFPGRYVMKNKLPELYKILQQLNERSVADGFQAYLKEVKPDVVHSFVMYMSCSPILEVMKKNHHIKWVYSAWGNDLFFYQNHKVRLDEIKSCLPNIDYMFADCQRDINIAIKYGFKGVSLGVFPGGGGYNTTELSKLRRPFNDRKTIIIKGYEHHFGRCNVVLEALLTLKGMLSQYKIFVYGDNEAVQRFAKEKGLNTWTNFRLLGKITHNELLKLKGEALIYIGNSISDGMPNTLLEAIIMGAFPIQSNPGGATSEIIENRVNGLIIENPLDSNCISSLLNETINNERMLLKAFDHNLNLSKKLEYNTIKKKVLNTYENIKLN